WSQARQGRALEIGCAERTRGLLWEPAVGQATVVAMKDDGTARRTGGRRTLSLGLFLLQGTQERDCQSGSPNSLEKDSSLHGDTPVSTTRVANESACVMLAIRLRMGNPAWPMPAASCSTVHASSGLGSRSNAYSTHFCA